MGQASSTSHATAPGSGPTATPVGCTIGGGVDLDVPLAAEDLSYDYGAVEPAGIRLTATQAHRAVGVTLSGRYRVGCPGLVAVCGRLLAQVRCWSGYGARR